MNFLKIKQKDVQICNLLTEGLSITEELENWIALKT